jgi:Uma2 family endonuclease
VWCRLKANLGNCVLPESVLRSPDDDGIVVCMAKRYGAKRLSVDAYWSIPESTQPMELVYGYVRQPPGPLYPHQAVVTGLTAHLFQHVSERQLGRVCVAPIDVVLDKDKGLVVQPDVIFIAKAREHIIDGRVWGAPDLVIEILSPRTAQYDRTTKLGWYRHYGVRECWLVDERLRRVDVLDLTDASEAVVSVHGDQAIVSRVLPAWNLSVSAICR